MAQPVWKTAWQFLKTKYVTIMWSSNCIDPKEKHPQETQNLYKNVHHSFIQNSPKLGTTQMSFGVWVVEPSVVYPYHEISFSNKKQQIIDTCKSLDKSPENHAEWEKKANPISLHTIWFHLYNILEMTKV